MWGQYYLPDFADIAVYPKEFRLAQDKSKIFPAFKWKNGKVYALTFRNNSLIETEYLYLHIQKRAMKFESGLENEDSFMIIPNEFVKDHELTHEEAQQLMKPDLYYEDALDSVVKVD